MNYSRWKYSVAFKLDEETCQSKITENFNFQMKQSKILTAVALSVSQSAALQLRDKEVQQDLERVDLKQLVGPGPQIEV